jgi:hypothetical protein
MHARDHTNGQVPREWDDHTSGGAPPLGKCREQGTRSWLPGSKMGPSPAPCKDCVWSGMHSHSRSHGPRRQDSLQERARCQDFLCQLRPKSKRVSIRTKDRQDGRCTPTGRDSRLGGRSLRKQTYHATVVLALLVLEWMPRASCYWSKTGRWIPGNEPEHWHDGHLGDFYKKPREKFGVHDVCKPQEHAYICPHENLREM